MITCICEKCEHRHVCSLKSKYQDTLDKLKEHDTIEEFHISLSCKHCTNHIGGYIK